MASAQHYEAQVEEVPFQPIPIPGGGPETVIPTATFQGWGYGSVQHIDFSPGFDVGFFGQMYSQFRLLNDGTVTFDPDVPTNTTRNMRAIPSTSAPNWSMAAVWWDQSTCNNSPGGPVKTQVVGTAPNRKFVIEWSKCRRYAASPTGTWEAQIWLSEGADEVVMHYGEITPSNWVAGMGVENSDGTDGAFGPSAAGGNCTPNCGEADFPTDKKIVYSSGANITVAGSKIEADLEGFAGIAYPVSFEMINNGSKPAENFTVQFWVNTEPALTMTAISMGYADGNWSLAPKESIVVNAEPRLPIELEEGEYYLIIEADPHHEVELAGRGSTVAVFGPFTIGLRAPNLSVGWVDTPEVVTPGSSFDVPWLAKNVGNLDTFDIPYRVVLSRSRSVSPLSVTIGSGTIPYMDLQQESEMTTEVTLPFDIDPGLYYVGVQMDPDRVVFEHERRDNAGMSNPVLIWDQGLVVLTQELPAAHFQGHYSVRLMAYGGDGYASWTVKPGSTLPPGMSLAIEGSTSGETATFLRGIPSKKGMFPFTLEVRSGEHVEEQQYTFEVSAGEHALSVMTQSLAEAAFGFEYEDWLSGLGGIPPYNWELANGSLPQGIFLRADGLLSGRPEEDGLFNVTFRLTDSQGLQTTRELALNVTPPLALTCVTKELPRLKLGEGMRPVPLLAAGGIKTETGAYIWDSVSTVRQVTTIGELSMNIEEGLPPGLRLEQGSVQGTPREGGTYTWTVKVTDTVGATQDCPIRVDVERDHGLTVATRSLPIAVAGRSYRAKIEVLGGDGHHQFSELEPGRTLADMGLRFDENGFLTGTPSLDLLEGESEKEFAFTVRVQDEKNRIGIGALTIRLHAKGLGTSGQGSGAADDPGGCQTGSGDTGLWLAALLGLAALGRRRQ